jgi:anhydro-N-acetylmuramic acid kinase
MLEIAEKIKGAGAIWAIGMMSGTSLDGIDVALLRTNGETISEYGDWLTIDIPRNMQQALRGLMKGDGDFMLVERDFTRMVADVVNQLVAQSALTQNDIAVIGFHGQSIIHRPKSGASWQLGNAALLAELTGISVVTDFRRADIAAGGQGAPLVPVYHAALSKGLDMPVAVINIGGVANVTWINGDDILAFDTGPGNALINDWVSRYTSHMYDTGGAMAMQGQVHQGIINDYLSLPYFSELPPKSLDRNYFTLDAVEGLSLNDGVATLTQLTVQSIARAAETFPRPAQRWLICGGGRHNKAIMQGLSALLGDVAPVETVGWRGDALEAEAFAYLAVRSLRGLHLTLPTTTGVSRAVSGGALYLSS